MPDAPFRLSLEQLRKQAKERLKLLRETQPAATLASVQFALAREHGYESWPRLVHALAGGPNRLAQLEQLARDLVAAAGQNQEALQRLSEYTGTSYSLERLHLRVLDWLADAAGPREARDWTLDDARHAVARRYGFDTWANLAAAMAEPEKGPATRSRSAPFFDLDPVRGTIELRPPLTDADWEYLADVIEETGVTGVQANGQMTDAGLARLCQLTSLTRLNLDGSQRVSDEGLFHLSQMPQLEELDLSGTHTRFTDAGLACLPELSRLRVFRACWAPRITDAGVSRLAACHQLEHVNLLGSPTGDGAVAALAGKPALRQLHAGARLTDQGLTYLHQIPAFRSWGGEAPRYDLMSFDAGPTFLLLDGPITDQGLRQLAGLEGVFGLTFFWHTRALTSAGLSALSVLPNLGMLGCQDALCDDVAMQHIGALPKLRMLMAQGTVAGDAGFVALSRSATLEHIWGRDSANLGNRGFEALATMPALKGMALSLVGVSDATLAALPSFPALTGLVPMDVQDDAFIHIGRCAGLERLWCMYCRDTGDRATEQLAGLQHLRYYYAGRTRITDRSLAVLGGIRSLEELEFWQTAGISNAGLSHLAALPRLRELSISGATGVTREGLKAIPDRVRVQYRG